MFDMQNGTLAAANNLLKNCAALVPGQRVLVLTEPAGEGHYDASLGPIVADAARAMGVEAHLRSVPFTPEVTLLDDDLIAAMTQADCTIFFARLGDQIRFMDHARGRRAIVTYVLDEDMFGSAFGWAHYGAFSQLKTGLDTHLARAGRIRVTCPLGTDFEGPGQAAMVQPAGDVSVKRFPMSVFAPVPAKGFSGRLAQKGFLTGTCSRFYEPYAAELDEVLYIDFKDNQITGFAGTPGDVRRAEQHYDAVAGRFGIDRSYVHSWHVGIHPGCGYGRRAAESYERWCAGAFGNPRILHFHTCGAYAPGEISINVVDPTVEVDGVRIWEDGVLYPTRIPGGAEILAAYPCAAHAFDNPTRAIGM